MVIDANSAPAGTPNMRWGNFFQCETAHLWYSKAVKQPWSQPLLGLHSSALLLASLFCTSLGCSAVLWSAPSLGQSALASSGLSPSPPPRCLISARETQHWLFCRKGTCAPRARGELAYSDKCPSKWSLIGLFSCQKALFWLNRIEPLWLDRAAQLPLNGKSLSPIGWNKTLGSPL